MFKPTNSLVRGIISSLNTISSGRSVFRCDTCRAQLYLTEMATEMPTSSLYFILDLGVRRIKDFGISSTFIIKNTQETTVFF